MKRDDVSRYPYPLKLGMDAAHEKEQRFYGTQQGLAKSRKKSAAKTQQHWNVLNVLKRLGL